MPPRHSPVARIALIGAGFAILIAGFLFTRTAPPSGPPGESEWVPIPDPPEPDPRDTFPTVFRNVKPDVRYVGNDSRCAGCHPNQTHGYHRHPMGRSAGFVGRFPVIEGFDEPTHPRFSRPPFSLRVEQAGTGFVHRLAASAAPGEEYAVAADLAIGSGTRGRSYLALQSGAVWQSPISWFSEPGRWDLSPGFDLTGGGRRPITAECLFCHVDRVEPLAGSVNRYREPLIREQAAIGCERCHGPAELHLSERALAAPPMGRPDASIVNPRHLPTELQASICAQCHLQGQARVVRRGRDLFEYRPGLPFESFVTVFVRHPGLADLQRSVGQFEQLQQSRCFLGSNGAMTCSTCHDSHDDPRRAGAAEQYRARCLQCHSAPARTCAAPAAARQGKGDSCSACHLPKRESSNIAHTSVSDHRIPARVSAPREPAGPGTSVPPLVPFALGSHQPDADEMQRDLGIALARLGSGSHDAAHRRRFSELAAERLLPATQRRRGDAEAWLALCLAQSGAGDEDAAWVAASRAAALAPDSEPALTSQAGLALALKKFEEVESIASRLIAVHPTAVEPLLLRATGRLGRADAAGADEDCKRALRIHPLHPQTRILAAVCRHRLGDPDGGRRAAEVAAELAGPARRPAFLEWYRDQIR